MIKRILYIYFASILFAALSYAEIKVEISMDKYEFLEAEPIFLKVNFFNNSNSIDSINYYPIEEFYNYMEVNGINEKKIFKGGIIVDFLRTPYTLINPHQNIYRIFNLLEYRGDVKLKYSLHGRGFYLSNGKYTLNYSFNKEFKSNEIKFTVKTPEGNELNIFNKLIRAYEINDGRPWTLDSIILKKDTYYDIVVNNPESIYWEEAVFRYNEECKWLKQVNTDTNTNKEFIKRFPNSFFMKDVLISLCKSMYHSEEGEPAVILFLNYLMENYPNYSVSALAKEQLVKKEYLN
jgi:hypothetical protein